MGLMNLITTELDETRHTGVGQFEIVAGERLKIETSPGGAEVLDVEVPAGKKWAAVCWLWITELDA